MPRLKPRRTFKSTDVAVAWQAFAWGDAVYVTGTELRGNHPAVQANPGHFVPADLPRSEWPNMYDQLPPPNPGTDAGERLIPAVARLELEDAVVCITGFQEGLGMGRTVAKGQYLHRADPIVKRHPEFFATPPKPLEAS